MQFLKENKYMAKSKNKTTIKTLERRIANMSTTRKKRRTKRRRSLSAAGPRAIVRRFSRRRRKKGFLGDSGRIMPAIKTNFSGAIGGALMVGVDMLPFKKWIKLSIGAAGSIAASVFNAPHIGSGMAGALAYSSVRTMFPTLLSDDLEDAQYVDPATLSDSGYIDDNGNAIVQDNSGVMYQLQDNGDLNAIGDAYSLNDSMQSVSMLPLSDPYSLNDRFDI